MSFLPFVFTFLLLLTLISSFLFTSVMGTARESKMLKKQHAAYHALLSEQNKKAFKEYKKPTPPGPKPKKPRSQAKEDEKKAPRAFHEGAKESKMNIAALYDKKNPELQHLVKDTLIQLIKILYGPYEFANGEDVAFLIVQQMMEKEIVSLEDVKFKDRALDEIYYKMLKGTNTGYPALGEYVRIDKKGKPIYFKYAPKQVIQAAVGNGVAMKVFELEERNWRANHGCKALKKEDFKNLLKGTKFPIDLLFDFQNGKKGAPQIYREGGEKIRALHSL